MTWGVVTCNLYYSCRQFNQKTGWDPTSPYVSHSSTTRGYFRTEGILIGIQWRWIGFDGKKLIDSDRQNCIMVRYRRRIDYNDADRRVKFTPTDST